MLLYSFLVHFVLQLLFCFYYLFLSFYLKLLVAVCTNLTVYPVHHALYNFQRLSEADINKKYLRAKLTSIKSINFENWALASSMAFARGKRLLKNDTYKKWVYFKGLTFVLVCIFKNSTTRQSRYIVNHTLVNV